MSAAVIHPTATPVPFSEQARLYLAAFVIVLIAEYIGNVAIPMGPAKIVLLPLLWALLMGAALGLASKRMDVARNNFPVPVKIRVGR